MPIFEYDLKTNITLVATYFPLAGLLLTYFLTKRYPKTKWLILALGPLFICAVMYLAWGLFASKVVLEWITKPFYISAFLFTLYLAGHTTYLFVSFIKYFYSRKKEI